MLVIDPLSILITHESYELHLVFQNRASINGIDKILFPVPITDI
jgi:hypothetical protein